MVAKFANNHIVTPQESEVPQIKAIVKRMMKTKTTREERKISLTTQKNQNARAKKAANAKGKNAQSSG